MTLLGSVDIPFTKSTKIAVDATDTAGQAATVAQQATDTAGQAQATAQTASQTATQAAATAAGAAQAAQTAITTANGKNKAYYGATTPISPKSGDIWFVEDSSGNVTAIKHYDGTQWVTDVDNTALEQQISAAQAAADNAVTVGQTAQQTATDAKAKGDAAATAAEEAKDAATKAQADAASAVTSANNAVSTANQATQVAQDAIDKAQDGFDAAQDALSKADAAETNSQSALNTANTAAKDAQSALTAANNATDTANTAKQVASDAATQASTAKTNAQTAMSNAQDAINQAKAANDNANTREKSIIKSNTAPSNPATDQLWIDTSKTPQIMRRWNGSTWVDLSPTQASQIGAVSTTTYTTDITNINNTLSQKASVTTVNTLSGRVDSAETAITQNANDIALKADKSYVDTIKNTVDNHSTLISQNADAIALKASQSTVDALTGRVSTAEATLKTQADQIAARITKTDADAKYATQASLTATANSLTSNISAVQTNLDNLQVGGRNLLLGTVDSYRNVTVSQWSGTIAERKHYSEYGLKAGDYITFGVDIKSNNGKTLVARIDFYSEANSDAGKTVFVSTDRVFPGSEGRSSVTVKLDETKPYIWLAIQNNSSTTETASTTEQYKCAKLEKGNRATDWTPAPEDLATVVQFNTLSQTVDSTVSRIGNAEGNISALQQTANSFATRISSAEGNISTLTQTTNGLQAAVSGKVDTTTYNSFVTQTNTALQSKLSATDADRKYATQSQLTQTASSLQSTISSTNKRTDVIKVRYIRDWANGSTANSSNHWTEIKAMAGTVNRALNATVTSNGSNSSNQDKTVITDGSLSGYFDGGAGNIYVLVDLGTIYDDIDYIQIWHYYKDGRTYNGTKTEVSSDGESWTTIFDSSISSTYQETSDGRAFIVNGITTFVSQISQLSNDINLRVQKGDVINQINVSTEGILIDGKKVHITGQTTIDNAVIKDAMIQSMTANKLTAGTIDANVINVTNINASNIVTGTLDASKATVTNIDASKITTGTLNAARIAAGSIDASKLSVSSLSAISANLGTVTAGNISGVSINIGNGNFTVDTAGNLIARNANITGTINATSGTFSGSLNGATGTFKGQMTAGSINIGSNFSVDSNGNLIANNAKLNGNMELNGTFNIPTTLTGDDGGAGLHGRYQYTESLSSYNAKILDGDWFLNSASLGFRTKATVQENNTTYFGTSYYGATMLKLRAYVNSSNNQYDGNFTNLNNRIDIMPSKITMGQYQPSGSSDWPDEIEISADGSIYASKTIKSGNVYFNGANSIKNDSAILYLEGKGGIQTNNILINGNHAIKSLDGGEIYLNNSGTGYVDLTVKTLHQASRWELKENFEVMDPEIALKNIINTDVVRYNFKGESEIHVGLVIDDRDNPEYRACSDFITPDRQAKKDETIVGELMLATKALNNYANDHNERLSVIEEQNKNLLLQVAELQLEVAELKEKMGA